MSANTDQLLDRIFRDPKVKHKIALVKQMQEEVLANANVNVFEEVFKLLFVKLWDEERASDLPDDDSSICQFRITADEPDQQSPASNVFRMNSLDPREWKRDQGYKQEIADKQLFNCSYHQ